MVCAIEGPAAVLDGVGNDVAVRGCGHGLSPSGVTQAGRSDQRGDETGPRIDAGLVHGPMVQVGVCDTIHQMRRQEGEGAG